MYFILSRRVICQGRTLHTPWWDNIFFQGGGWLSLTLLYAVHSLVASGNRIWGMTNKFGGFTSFRYSSKMLPWQESRQTHLYHLRVRGPLWMLSPRVGGVGHSRIFSSDRRQCHAQRCMAGRERGRRQWGCPWSLFFLSGPRWGDGDGASILLSIERTLFSPSVHPSAHSSSSCCCWPPQGELGLIFPTVWGFHSWICCLFAC